jgi:hypothetical protein
VDRPSDQPVTGEGAVDIASVEHGHDRKTKVVVFTVTEHEMMVDGNASTLPPGVEMSFGLLAYQDSQAVASQLRIQLITDGEPGYQIERFVELEEGDCAEGGGAAFGLTVQRGGNLTVAQSGESARPFQPRDVCRSPPSFSARPSAFRTVHRSRPWFAPSLER